PQVAPAESNGKGKARLGEDRTHMGWHIVVALVGMSEVGVSIGDEPAEEPFEVAADFGLGILAHDQRCTRMVYEDVAQSCFDRGFANHALDLIRDLDRPAS